MSEYSTILFSVRDKVAHLTLNRPEAANSLNVTARWAFALLGPDGAPNRYKKEKIDAGPPTATALAPSI